MSNGGSENPQQKNNVNTKDAETTFKNMSPNMSVYNTEGVMENFREAMQLILTNPDFRDLINMAHPQHLSETYCMLWLDPQKGGISHRRSSSVLQTGAYAACLLDLVILGKIKIEEEHQTPPKLSCFLVKVINEEPSGLYLDDVAFNAILRNHQMDPKTCKSLEYWLLYSGHRTDVNPILQNLISKNILREQKSSIIGMKSKFPLQDDAYLAALQGKLHAITLEGEEPDIYMLSVITLCRTADHLYSLGDPILQKHFKRNYKRAKENMKIMVHTQGAVLQSLLGRTKHTDLKKMKAGQK